MQPQNNEAPYRVLFLCTGNSARSIMAEAILSRLGGARFQVASAGSRPTGQIQPDIANLLEQLNHDLSAVRSKGLDAVIGPDHAPYDFVFILCDGEAEACPVVPGDHLTLNWPFPDPARFQVSDPERAALVADLYRQMTRLMEIFVSLPLDRLDRAALKARLQDMGPAQGAPRGAPHDTPQGAA